MLKTRSKKKGFTLVEVVLSITILAIIVTPILSMVLTSVKINKESEDKQKALYIAQQIVEQQKAASDIKVGITTTTAIDFTVTKTITELPEYKFPDSNINNEDSGAGEGDNKAKTFSEIKYDVKLQVNSTEDENILNITYHNKNDINESYKQFKLDKFGNVLNITNYDGNIIINVNKDNDTTIEDDTNKIIGYKVDSSEDTEVGNVVIQYNTDTQPDIDIHGLNNCDNDLVFYFATSKEEEFNYSLINDGGKIKSYYNITSADSQNSYSNNSRVYRMDIEVSKNGKSLQKITAFKIAAE